MYAFLFSVVRPFSARLISLKFFVRPFPARVYVFIRFSFVRPFCTRMFTSLPFRLAFSPRSYIFNLLFFLPILTVCTLSALNSYQCHIYATLKLLTLSLRSYIFNPPFFFARSLRLHIICTAFASQLCDSEKPTFTNSAHTIHHSLSLSLTHTHTLHTQAVILSIRFTLY